MDIACEKIDLLKRPWQYRGEGNANIVLALEEELRVIRLPKSPKGKHQFDANNEIQNDSLLLYKKLRREVCNTNDVLRRLVASNLVSPATIIEITQDQISLLNEKLQFVRPRPRLHKELRYTYGTCHTDFARLHSVTSKKVDYCVEIKPKQGYLNSSSLLYQTSGLCQFCMHQFLKLKEGIITTRSDYCPLDLFSGSPSRVIHALFSLLYNPQNNLRIFRNGLLVYDEIQLENLEQVLIEAFSYGNTPDVETNLSLEDGFSKPPDSDSKPNFQRALKKFLYILSVSLNRPVSPQSTAASSTSNKEFLVFEENVREYLSSSQILPLKGSKTVCNNYTSSNNTEGVLETILSLQLTSTEQSASMLEMYKKICPMHARSTADISTDLLCPSLSCFDGQVWIDDINEDNNFNNRLSQEEVTRIEKFLLSATAKDCSIMITFSPIGFLSASEISSLEDQNKNNSIAIACEHPSFIFYLRDLENTSFVYKVKLGLADLDIKPITCIPKQYIRDCDLLQSYNELSK